MRLRERVSEGRESEMEGEEEEGEGGEGGRTAVCLKEKGGRLRDRDAILGGREGREDCQRS